MSDVATAGFQSAPSRPAPAAPTTMPLFGDVDKALADDARGEQLATWLGLIDQARQQVKKQRSNDPARRNEEALFFVALSSAEHVLISIWNTFHPGGGRAATPSSL